MKMKFQPQFAQGRRLLRGQQSGTTAMGVIIGLLIGLGLALAVALYVTKVPVPFVNKVPQRSAEQEAAENERNKNWDPNAKLGGTGKPVTGAGAATGPSVPGAPATGASGAATSATIPPYVPPVPPPSATPSAQSAPKDAIDKIAADKAAAEKAAADKKAAADRAAAERAAADKADKAKNDAVAAPAARSGPDPFTYFVQAGAYTRQEDAEQQRGRLAMLGFQAKITEREQVGRTMYRVRIGPFDTKDLASNAQGKLQQAGVDAALVAVERPR